jgi:hypothetical protein
VYRIGNSGLGVGESPELAGGFLRYFRLIPNQEVEKKIFAFCYVKTRTLRYMLNT